MKRQTICGFILTVALGSAAQNISSERQHTQHDQLDILTKVVHVWTNPTSATIEPEFEMLYELEFEYLFGHYVVSTFVGLCVPQHAKGQDSKTGYEAGILGGYHWDIKRSSFDVQAGASVLSREYEEIATSKYITPETRSITSVAAVVEFGYKYKIKDHLAIGADIPIAASNMFSCAGISMTVGYSFNL